MSNNIERFANRASKNDFYKKAAMAQKELIDHFQGDGAQNAVRHCAEFIAMAIELMSDYDEEDELPDADTKTVNIKAVLDDVEAWRAQKDGRCAVMVCGWREQGGKMKRTTIIVGSKPNLAEVLRDEYDEPDGIFARRLELAGITSKKNDNKK